MINVLNHLGPRWKSEGEKTKWEGALMSSCFCQDKLSKSLSQFNYKNNSVKIKQIESYKNILKVTYYV